MNSDDRSLRDKIKDAPRATAEIKRHLEHLTEEALARLNRQNEVPPRGGGHLTRDHIMIECELRCEGSPCGDASS